jgi:biotin carboxylase
MYPVFFTAESRRFPNVPQPATLTLLCIATFEKGHEFLRECHRKGHHVLLLTADKLRDAEWPREAIEEFFFIPRDIARDDLLKGVSHIARTRQVDRIVPLDDFDVETAALLREHLRIPGMGETTARYFRDKLAMRVKARNADVLVPDFVHVLNDSRIAQFAEQVPGPYVLKPRSSAAAIGIQRLDTVGELWSAIEALGDRRSFFVLERYVPGDVYHVDSIVWEREVLYHAAHKYGTPPMNTAHDGGVFTTRTLPRDVAEARPLAALNREVITTFGLVRGVTHTEFIRAHEDGRWYFLETSARVGGAFIVDVVEAASGLNLWREWAHIEIAGEDYTYHLPNVRSDYAGLILTLAREPDPDLSSYDAPEVVVRIQKHHHAGVIVVTPDSHRLDHLLTEYAGRFQHEFMAWQPVPESPTA